MLLSLLAASAIEEIVFRAGVQESLLRMAVRVGAFRGSVGAFSISNLLTALLFAVCHGFARSWLLALAAFPAALVLGLLYERYRSVWACIALHAAMNALWFCFAMSPAVPQIFS